jgi:hypothetical protein
MIKIISNNNIRHDHKFMTDTIILNPNNTNSN